MHTKELSSALQPCIPGLCAATINLTWTRRRRSVDAAAAAAISDQPIISHMHEHAHLPHPQPPPCIITYLSDENEWRLIHDQISVTFYFLIPACFDTITQTQKDKINNNQKATMPMVSYQEARDAPTEPINTKGATAKSKRGNLTISFGEPFQRVINTSSVLFSIAVFLPNRGSSLSRNLSSAHTLTQGRQLWPF